MAGRVGTGAVGGCDQSARLWRTKGRSAVTRPAAQRHAAREGDFADPTDAELARFSPFNLIRVIGGAATFWTNQPEPQRQDLSPGVYGLSNGQLDEPWPKTVRLKTILSDWLANSDDPDVLMDGLHEDRLEQEGVVPTEPSDAP